MEKFYNLPSKDKNFIRTIKSETGRTQITAIRLKEHIRIDIKHNYGDYYDTDIHGKEILKNNTGYETLYSNSNSIAYALSRGKNHWRRYF